MDDLILYTLDDYVTLTKGYGYDSQTAINILNIAARRMIAKAIKDCFERTNTLPNIQEALVMAGNNISDAIGGLSDATEDK